MLVRVVAAFDLLVQEALLGVAADLLQTRHAVDHVHRQAEAVDVVVDRQLQRRIDVAASLCSRAHACCRDCAGDRPAGGSATDSRGS